MQMCGLWGWDVEVVVFLMSILVVVLVGECRWLDCILGTGNAIIAAEWMRRCEVKTKLRSRPSECYISNAPPSFMFAIHARQKKHRTFHREALGKRPERGLHRLRSDKSG